ncbi:MAG: hypothetical protein ACYDEX_03625 [Mobilitalea sp.]
MSTIINEYQSKDCISNIRGTVDDKNEISLVWEWPSNKEYNLCVVFETEGFETLEELLASNSVKTVYADEFNVHHKAHIRKNSIQFSLFPAKKNKTQELVYINQKENNESSVFHKRILIDYQVVYKKTGMFNKYKKATLLINPSAEINDEFLYYKCVGGSNEDFIYSIDLHRFGKYGPYEIFVNDNEKIILVLNDQQIKYITVHERGM